MVNYRDMKKGALSTDNLCKLISEKCNYTDPASIKQFYLGLLRVIMDGLRENESMYLENLGEFKITKIKERKSTMVVTGEKIIMPECKVLKFIPCKKIKYYVKNKL